MSRMARLHIDSLPDAAGCGVPMPLFANWLLGIIHRIFDAQDNQGAPGFFRIIQSLSQIEFKGRVAAFVMA